jgi:AraC family transcriptional regulator
VKQQNTIRESVDFIEQNLTEEISLTHLASRAYISKFHFHRIFRQMVGESVMQYIRKRRLAEAAGELKKTRVTITDIALKYQFGSEESFARAFKRLYGISPKAYRRSQTVILSLSKTELRNNPSAIKMAA